jgi:allophanate hydrolase
MSPRRATEAVELALAAIAADASTGVWIALVGRTSALDDARAVEARVAAGENLPLAGTTFAVKDNIDVAGMPTTAACPAFGYVAADDAPVVNALRAAGAVVMGKTNMDQFATGLVGTRSPYGICPNAHWSGLVAGGSSAGSAVAVARGLVDFALGTDTAGSGRVPAACNGIIGLKPTRGRISNRGVVPACRSLDCVSLLARDIELAALTTSIAAQTAPDPADPWSRAAPRANATTIRRVGVPHADQLDFDGDDRAAMSFGRAVDELATIGVDICPFDIGPMLAVSRLLYGGAFVAERYEAVGAFVTAHRDEVDPVVGKIISDAAAIPAWQAYRDRSELERLRGIVDGALRDIDAVIVPSVPRVPSITEVLANPVSVNEKLGTYTNFVNLLDLCALTMPYEAIASDRPPFSITFVAPAWHDAALVTLARLLRLDTRATHRSV